jgi:hypothetical protein
MELLRKKRVMSATYSLRSFDPTASKGHRIFLLLGGRGTGKTTLLFDLLYHMRERFDFVLAMTSTKETYDALSEIMPRRMIHGKGYDFGVSDAYMETCKAMVRRGTPRSSCLILDDVVYDKTVLKSQNIRELAFNGRHQKSCVIITCQYLMNLPCDIRGNIDYVFTCRESVNSNRKKLYEFFFGGFPTFFDFCKVLTACTKDYGVLVMDRTNATGSIETTMFHYRAQKNIPKFKIGRQVYFDLSKCVDSYVREAYKLQDGVKKIT